jgi:hypothetical protein
MFNRKKSRLVSVTYLFDGETITTTATTTALLAIDSDPYCEILRVEEIQK